MYVEIERLSSHELKEYFCISRFHSHTTTAGLLQYNSSGLLVFAAQHPPYYVKKMPRKAFRLLRPNNIITSILLVVCASSEKCACRTRMIKKLLAAGVHKIDETKL